MRSITPLPSCAVLLAAMLTCGIAAHAQTFTLGRAQLTVEPSGRLNLAIDGKPFLQDSYAILGLPNSEASLWSVGEAQEELSVEEADGGTVRAQARREIPGVVSQEMRAAFSAEMLSVHWRLRFGDLPEDRDGGYREVGFFIPWETADGMMLHAETIFSADIMDVRVQADLRDGNPAPGGTRRLRLRDDARSISIEPLRMLVQSRPEGYRIVSGGRIQGGQEVVLGVLFDWSGALDDSEYDTATGAKRPQLQHLDKDGYAVDACAGRRHFYHPGEAGSVVLRTVAPDARRDTIPARFRIEDYWDRVVDEGDLALPLAPGRASVLVHQVPTDRTGMFRFVVDYDGADGESRSAQAVYGVVPARGEPPAGWDSPFGMHLPAGPHHALVGRQIGVAWCRAHDTIPYTQWRWAEPEEGRWSWHDREYDLMIAHGMSILGVLNRPPDWATEKAEGRNLLEWTDEDLRMWRRYCEQVISHYADRIRHWEVLNEPYGAILTERDAALRQRRAEGYVRLLRIAHETAQAIDPQLRIVGVCGPPGYYSMDWYPLTFRAGALDYMDILSAHMYPTFFRWPPRDARDWDRELEPDAWYRQVRDFLREHGREDLEIWNTEAGSHHAQTFYTDYEPGYSYGRRGPAPPERVQTFREAAMYTVRAAVIDLANGVKRFHYTGVGGAWYFHSIAEGDQTPMPAKVAWAVMTHLLNGARYHAAADLGEFARGHVFEVAGGAVAVVWGTGRAPSDWTADSMWLTVPEDAVPTAQELADLAAGRTVPARVGLLQACDIMGVDMPLRAGGRTGLALSEQPVWLEAPGMSAQAMLDELGAARIEH